MKSLITIILLLISLNSQAIQFNFMSGIFGAKKYSIKNFGSYKAYTDGTYANSCSQYKLPSLPYRFLGDYSSGTYRIQPGGIGTPYDVLCDMTNGINGTIDAIGGEISYSGNYRIHTFKTVGLSQFTLLSGSGPIEVLVVAGGGGSARSTYGYGGGGGGGILYHSAFNLTTNTTVTVGAGGSDSVNGGDSFFGILQAMGGGSCNVSQTASTRNGGSGGGAGHMNPAGGLSLSNQTSNNGGIGYGNGGGASIYSAPYYQGSGGGAGGVGGAGAAGGPGRYFSISGVNTPYSGGGGQTTNSGAISAGGVGGGGSNGSGGANTGGGAGGGQGTYLNYTGGSGIVIVKYLYKL